MNRSFATGLTLSSGLPHFTHQRLGASWQPQAAFRQGNLLDKRHASYFLLLSIQTNARTPNKTEDLRPGPELAALTPAVALSPRVCVSFCTR
jgi:hypothetical protein